MEQFARENLAEWKRILAYWEKYAPDYQRGGFHGRVNYDNQPVLDASRSIILTSRILWTFSLAYRYFHRRKYLVLADRAYHTLPSFFK
jgi:cellobiose epimerase